MLVHIPDLLDAEEIADCRGALAGAAWVDGRGTAGHLSAAVKHNAQVHWQDPAAQRLGGMVSAKLERNAMFLSAALPASILPLLFNRYQDGDYYGPHLDGAIRSVEGANRRIRTDLSMTLMLSDPADYDGGELRIIDLAGGRSIKLQLFAGDERALGPGRADVLAAIEREGSISAAGRSLGMSYRYTWALVESMNNCFVDKLVEAAPGGRRGGGAALTAAGRRVLEAYRALEAQIMANAPGEGLEALSKLLRRPS